METNTWVFGYLLTVPMSSTKATCYHNLPVEDSSTTVLVFIRSDCERQIERRNNIVLPMRWLNYSSYTIDRATLTGHRPTPFYCVMTKISLIIHVAIMVTINNRSKLTK
jgi:hypothetical protein